MCASASLPRIWRTGRELPPLRPADTSDAFSGMLDAGSGPRVIKLDETSLALRGFLMIAMKRRLNVTWAEQDLFGRIVLVLHFMARFGCDAALDIALACIEERVKVGAWPRFLLFFAGAILRRPTECENALRPSMEFVADKMWYEFPPALRPPLARGGMDAYTLDSRSHIKHTMDALPDEWVHALTALDHSSDMRIRIYCSDKSFGASMVDRYFGKREHAGDDQQRTTKRPRTWLSDIPPAFWDIKALPPLPPSQSIQMTYQTKSPRPLKPPPPLKQLPPSKPRGQQLLPHSTQKPAKRSAQQNHKQHVRQPAKRDVKQQAVTQSAKRAIKKQAVQQSASRAVEKNAKQTQEESVSQGGVNQSTMRAIEQQAIQESLWQSFTTAPTNPSKPGNADGQQLVKITPKPTAWQLVLNRAVEEQVMDSAKRAIKEQTVQESLWQSSKAGQQATDKRSAKQIVDHFVKLTKKPSKPAKQPVEPTKSIKKPKKLDQAVQPRQSHQSHQVNRANRSDRGHRSNRRDDSDHPVRPERPRPRGIAPAPDDADPAINVISGMFANINMKL